MMINKMALKVNPSTPQNKYWTCSGLTLSGAFTRPWRIELGAAEWVNPALKRAISRISIEISPKIIYVDII
jgi:hypothetical protein